MQHKYTTIKKLEVELRQLKEPVDLPARPCEYIQFYVYLCQNIDRQGDSDAYFLLSIAIRRQTKIRALQYLIILVIIHSSTWPFTIETSLV